MMVLCSMLDRLTIQRQPFKRFYIFVCMCAAVCWPTRYASRSSDTMHSNASVHQTCVTIRWEISHIPLFWNFSSSPLSVERYSSRPIERWVIVESYCWALINACIILLNVGRCLSHPIRCWAVLNSSHEMLCDSWVIPWSVERYFKRPFERLATLQSSLWALSDTLNVLLSV